MAFRAQVEVLGKVYDVLQVRYEFSRDTDKKGKVSSGVYGGRINVTIESTADTTVIEGMLNSQFKAVAGKVTFKKTEEDATMKEIEFKNSYIVYYAETVNVNEDQPMTINFTVSAEEMSIGTASIDNRWPVA